VLLPVIDEMRGGAILGCLIMYGIMYAFISGRVRLIIGLALLLAVTLSVVVGVYAYLYGWLIFVVVVVSLDGLRRIFEAMGVKWRAT
jgi:hypothetical protein